MAYGTYRDWERERIDLLMVCLRPDGAPLFRNREEALAALRRFIFVTKRKDQKPVDA